MKEELASALTEFIQRKAEKNFSLVCTVNSVDTLEMTCYCEPVGDYADIQQARLIADKTGDGFVLIPKLGSTVIVTFLSESSAYISMISEVQEIHLAGVNYGGLVVSADLVTRLNNVESKINDLILAITGWTVVANDGGAALKAALGTWLATPVDVTVVADIQSTAVLHGDGA